MGLFNRVFVSCELNHIQLKFYNLEQKLLFPFYTQNELPGQRGFLCLVPYG